MYYPAVDFREAHQYARHLEALKMENLLSLTWPAYTQFQPEHNARMVVGTSPDVLFQKGFI